MATSSILGPQMSSAGLGSGLDVNSIVTQLMAAEARPLDLLKTGATELNTRLSSLGKMQSLFSAMRDKANALVSPTLWTATTAASSDAASLQATASDDARAGSHVVEISRLASAQTVVSKPMSGADAPLSAGTITIELGAWSDAQPPVFAPKAGAAAKTITIADGATSLAQVRDAINAAGAGVVANIVSDASGARLALRSAETGAANGFRLSVAETSADGDVNAGLSRLGFDAADAASPTTLASRAQDTAATIDGIAVTAPGQVLDGVIDGLKLTATKVTTAPVTVSVAADTSKAKTAITDFVGAFNALSTFIRQQTAYNEGSKSGGPLQGDSGTLSLQTQLRSIVNRERTADGSEASPLTRMSQFGIAMAADGTLAVDATKLDAALASGLAPLKAALAAGSGTGAAAANDPANGFARRFKALADAALGTDGVFDTRTATIKKSIDRNSKAQDDMQRRLDVTEARMRAQYTALDSTMSKMNGLAQYISQQMARL